MKLKLVLFSNVGNAKFCLIGLLLVLDAIVWCFAWKCFFITLLGLKNRYEIDTDKLNILGKAEAEIVGGNLSILYSLNATKYDLDFTDKILFIEDLNEYLYHLDRMMLNLKLSGKLAKLKAIIVGGMSNMLDNETPYGKAAYEIILEHVKEYNYPVLFNFPTGHIYKNYALTMGSRVSIEITTKVSYLHFV